LECIEKIERYTKDLDFEEFIRNDMVVDAVILSIPSWSDFQLPPFPLFFPCKLHEFFMLLTFCLSLVSVSPLNDLVSHPFLSSKNDGESSKNRGRNREK